VKISFYLKRLDKNRISWVYYVLVGIHRKVKVINNVMSETLRELRVNLGWSQKDLAEAAGISEFVASQAENGQRIMPKNAKAIANAFSKAYKREIRPLDIEGLNVR
jgi:predicted transcriptional regulator